VARICRQEEIEVYRYVSGTNIATLHAAQEGKDPEFGGSAFAVVLAAIENSHELRFDFRVQTLSEPRKPLAA
jgi:hypothetical protein